MKELEFMEKINDIDPALLEDQPAGKRRGSKTVRRVLIAAAAVLLLAGTAYGIARGVELRKTNDPKAEEQGFEAKAELPLVPWSSFTGEIREAGAQIAAQYENPVAEPAFSSYQPDPGAYTRRFRTIEEAVAYLGLEGFRTPGFPFAEYDCSVTASGNEEGRVEIVRLNAEHIEWNDVGAQLCVTVLTDGAKESALVTGSVWTWEFPRDVEFQHYATPGGNDCAIAVLRPEYDSDFMSLTGYMAVGSALYELNLGAVPKEKYETAMQMLRDWADGFDK